MQIELTAMRAARGACLMASCVLATGCLVEREPAPRAPRLEPAAGIKATIHLSHGAEAHIIEMPTDEFERARCLVVTNGNGQVAVSCTESRFLLPPDE